MMTETIEVKRSGKLLFQINDDGSIACGADHTPDEAALIFSNAMLGLDRHLVAGAILLFPIG